MIKSQNMCVIPLKRFGAYIVDMLIVSIFYLLLINILSYRFGFYDKIYYQQAVMIEGQMELATLYNADSFAKLLYAFLVINSMYFVPFLCSKKQATIGNQFFKIMVVHNKEIKLRVMVAFLRSIAVIINIQIYGLGLLTCFFRKDRAFLQDILSNTTVINLVQ